MDKIALISVMVTLLVILVMLVSAFAYTRSTQRKREKRTGKPAEKQQQIKPSRSFDELKGVIKNRQSSARILSDTLDELLLHYGSIHPKLGARPHPDFDHYVEIIMAVCRHPNTTKEIVIAFDKRLGEKNPTYRREIDDALQRGLSSRGI